QGNQVKHYFVDGGFVQVRGNVVTVLTSNAIPAKDIKVAEVEAVLRSTKVEATLEGREAHDKAQQRARVQLRIAQKMQS
ncbi:MAG TPA: hypothetical protein VKE42_11515, partial [Candidatus Cybelea sp.]|nr:hypothetical protein [Candidatus Cybelea sp.]